MTFRTRQGSNYGIGRGRVGEPAMADLSKIRHISCQPRFSRRGRRFSAKPRQQIVPPGQQISHLPRSLPRQAWTRNTKWSAIGSS
ncbi:hypothetical protein V6N12_050367 [Hibiscus sabdariffa]|uniref:Uncharacterized protein n=1 Tax=Hibiscus sabdariffa TaxID=183260 RepID=A0ABR2GDX9_9ROSI